MIHSKHIGLIFTAIFLAVILLVGVAAYAAGTGQLTQEPEYQTKLFGTQVATVDIKVDNSDWQQLLDSAIEKEYISGDVVINGEQVSTVGIRTKGNSSLTQVASSDSSRYSLVLNFSHYVKGQTYYGLDSLALNNIIGDATYMKDMISYDIMEYIGVATPLRNYAEVTVNGEHYGFCLLLERYDKSFLSREYGTTAGQLYNVKMVEGGMGGGGAEPQGEAGENASSIPADANQTQQTESGATAPVQVNQEQQPAHEAGQGPGNSSGGGSLLYTDDDVDSYASIFENAVFKKVSDREKKEIITAIKNLNEGTNLEQYFDVDEILRYFAAHTVVVNLDSYISNMQQNYYIYEKNGKITILPWDYNLAFGGFQNQSATDFVNFPIDTPVSGVEMEDRPLLNKLLEVEEYRTKYHEYLSEIVEGYFYSGLFEETVNSLDATIESYVQKDTTTFFSYEEYKNSLPVFIQLGTLRANSIAGQLNGSIPSTTEGQKENSAALIDASEISISALGTMGNGGGGGGGMPDNKAGGENAEENTADRELFHEARQLLQENGNTVTQEVKTALLALGLTEEQIEQIAAMGGGRAMGSPPGMQANGQQSGQGNTQSSMVWLLVTAASLVVLGVTTVFIARRKKKY